MVEMKPQMTQMDAYSDIQEIICANLCYLRLNNSLAQVTDKVLHENLEKIGV